MASSPPVDLQPLVERTDLVRPEFKRVPKNVIIFCALLVGAIVLSICGVVFWEALDDLSNESRSRRGRALEFVPFIAAFACVLFALAYSKRALVGEYVFTFPPTNEPMTTRAIVQLRGTVDDAQRLSQAFAAGDPRYFGAIWTRTPGPLVGRILIAPNARAAILTLGLNGRAEKRPLPLTIAAGTAYDRIMLVPKKSFRTGRLSGSVERQIAASLAAEVGQRA